MVKANRVKLHDLHGQSTTKLEWNLLPGLSEEKKEPPGGGAKAPYAHVVEPEPSYGPDKH
jgi:hypothetical protein